MDRQGSRLIVARGPRTSPHGSRTIFRSANYPPPGGHFGEGDGVALLRALAHARSIIACTHGNTLVCALSSYVMGVMRSQHVYCAMSHGLVMSGGEQDASKGA